MEGQVTIDFSWAQQAWQEAGYAIINHWTRPSVVFRPKIFRDGNKWCCLLGDDIQSGVVGFGDSPELATDGFDRAWNMKINVA